MSPFLQRFKDEYLSNPYYKGLYLHMTSNEVVNTIIVFFTGPFLYSQHISIPVIFLFYGFIGLIFSLWLLLVPVLVKKFGAGKTVIISYIFSSLFLISVSFSSQSLLFVVLAAAFHGLHKSFYYPAIDSIHAIFIEDKHRGKQLSLQSVFISLVSALSAFVAGWLLNINSYLLLFCIIIFFIIISVLPLFAVFKQKLETHIQSYKDIFAFTFSKTFRSRFVQTIGLATSNVVYGSVFSLYVFLFLKDFKLFSLVIVFSIVVENIVKLYFGRYIDHTWRKKGLTITSLFVGLGNIFLIFLNTSAMIVSLIRIYIQGAFKVLLMAYDANYNDKAKASGKPFLFSLSVLLVMGMQEIVFFGLCALLAWLLPLQGVFMIIFALSLIGLRVNRKYFKE